LLAKIHWEIKNLTVLKLSHNLKFQRFGLNGDKNSRFLGCYGLSKFNNNNNNNNNELRLGCHPVAVVILHVYKI